MGETIHMRDFIVKILVKLRLYRPAVELLNRIKQFFQARRVRKLGLETLHEADIAFSEAGLIMFPAFGTLLGAWRDHGFISYDFDLDVGVMAKDNLKLHDIMKQHGFVLAKQTYINQQQEQIVTEETYYYKGVGIDVFYYFEDGDDWFAYCPRKHEYKDWKEANATDGFPVARSYVPKTEFIPYDFYDIKLHIPEKTDQWLRDIYSDSYMTPIKNWKAEDYETRILPTKERCYRRIIK